MVTFIGVSGQRKKQTSRCKVYSQSQCLKQHGLFSNRNLLGSLVSQVGSKWMKAMRKPALMLNAWSHKLATLSFFDLIPLFSLAFACLFFNLWCYFMTMSSSSLLAFPLGLFKFGTLSVLKIPSSVWLAFLTRLKFLICQYLSHFCFDSLLCNGTDMWKGSKRLFFKNT